MHFPACCSDLLLQERPMDAWAAWCQQDPARGVCAADVN